MSASKITAVNFTYACPDGLWVRREDGSSTWLHAGQLMKEVGESEMGRLLKIAHANGMTGMWYSATNGRNCYVNGQLVNA
jgi:hypothetical protein